MYQAHTKEQERRRQILTYIVLPIFVIGAAILITYYIDGYRYDIGTRTIAQGGLVQVQSQPTGSTVTYDNEVLNVKTNMRIDAHAGSHTVTLARDGYRPWQKTVAVDPGQVLWLNYALMIPKEVTTTELAKYTSVDDSLVVHEKNRMIILEDSTRPDVTRITLDGATMNTSDVTISSNLYDTNDTSVKLQLISVDKSGRYVLVKAVGKQTDWLVIDMDNPGESRNVSDIVGQDISTALFSRAHTQDMYVVSEGTLRRIDFVEQIMSAPLASGVTELYQGRDGVLSYIATDSENANQLMAGYYTPWADTTRVFRQRIGAVADADSIRFRIDKYDRTYYAVIQNGLRLEIMSTNLPESDSDTTITTKAIETVAMQKHVDFVSFSPTARFVIAQEGADFTTYDLELDKITTSVLQGDTQASRQLQWADDYHLWSDRDDELALYEFDGANVQTIDKMMPDLDAMLSENKRSLYYFQPTSDGSISLRYLKLS